MIEHNESSVVFSELEKQISAKMVLDLRYYSSTDNKNNQINDVLRPVTKLPTDLANMITHSGIGGVVLFAENLISTEQIIELTNDMQQAALQSDVGQPLIISIDQEGGRVVRLPHATSFTGNMAIGSTYEKKGVTFASETSTTIARELYALGINNNYAPVIDVNTNASNPVINTRSFGENPQIVAELGSATVEGFQQQGVMSTLKHFPGHGDTQIDSHMALPLVKHNLKVIEEIDLKPFAWIIENCDPAMVMTAHIQYPALDDTAIQNINGEIIVRPATMSRKILTGLLRNEMGFNGLIVTDALDMAGISHHFNNVSAVVETFIAGADIALMPYRVRNKEDIEKFYQFIKDVSFSLQKKANLNGFYIQDIAESVTRINRYKAKYIKLSKVSVSDKIIAANKIIANKQHLKLEQSLANNSVVLLNNKNNKLPLLPNRNIHIHLLVLNIQEFSALENAITECWSKLGYATPNISATVLNNNEVNKTPEKLATADLIIATIGKKINSVVDIGSTEDILTNEYNDYEQRIIEQLTLAKKRNITSVVIAKGSPYLIKPYYGISDSILVNFDDRIYLKDNEKLYCPSYQTSIGIIFGIQNALGDLPVSL